MTDDEWLLAVQEYQDAEFKSFAGMWERRSIEIAEAIIELAEEQADE